MKNEKKESKAYEAKETKGAKMVGKKKTKMSKGGMCGKKGK